MIFFLFHMDMAEESFSLSQQYLEAPLSHSHRDVRLVNGVLPISLLDFLSPFWKYKKLHLRLCQRAKNEKNNYRFLAMILFLYFPRQQLHFLSQHSIDNSFSKHSSHTVDLSLSHCHVPTLLLSGCSQLRAVSDRF